VAGIRRMAWVGRYPVPMARCECWAVAGVGRIGRAAGVRRTVWVGKYPVPTERGGCWAMLGVERVGHVAVTEPCSTSTRAGWAQVSAQRPQCLLGGCVKHKSKVKKKTYLFPAS
jgi:hypothetical protein